MMKNFIQEGKTIEVTASGSAIASGDLVVVGDMVGVSAVDIADGETGTVWLMGVYEAPKASPLVINQGDTLYFDGTELTKTATGNSFAGYAHADAASADSVVLVKLSN
jgi:predicted RecA/RadA family phage recombinase